MTNIATLTISSFAIVYWALESNHLFFKSAKICIFYQCLMILHVETINKMLPRNGGGGEEGSKITYFPVSPMRRCMPVYVSSKYKHAFWVMYIQACFLAYFLYVNTCHETKECNSCQSLLRQEPYK